MSNSEENIEKHKELDNIDPFSLLSDTQWRYITAMVENPTFSKKAAAEYIGLSPPTVYEWKQKAPHVDEALEVARKNVHSATLSMRKQSLLKAMRVKIALLDSDDESIRSKASSEIVEWELGKAIQKQELEIEHSDVGLDDDQRIERIATLLDRARARRDNESS